MTPAKPISSASSRSSTNSSGLTHRVTGWWRGEGRRYWVIVMSSQPASGRACSAEPNSARPPPTPRTALAAGPRPALLGDRAEPAAVVVQVLQRRADLRALLAHAQDEVALGDQAGGAG